MPKRSSAPNRFCGDSSPPWDSDLMLNGFASDDCLKQEHSRTCWANHLNILSAVTKSLLPEMNSSIVKIDSCYCNELESSDSPSERSSDFLTEEIVEHNGSPDANEVPDDGAAFLSDLPHFQNDPPDESPCDDLSARLENTARNFLASPCDSTYDPKLRDFDKSWKDNNVLSDDIYDWKISSSLPRIRISRVSSAMLRQGTREELDGPADGAKRQCIALSDESVISSCFNRSPIVSLSDVLMSKRICCDVSVIVKRLPNEVLLTGLGEGREKIMANPCVRYDVDAIYSDDDSESDTESEFSYAPSSPLKEDEDVSTRDREVPPPIQIDVGTDFSFDSVDLNAQEVIDDSFLIVDFDSSWKQTETTAVEVCAFPKERC